MKRGEEVKIRISYDLFDIDVKGAIGVYVTTDPNSKKLLIFFPEFKEWGEFFKQQVKRVKPGTVTDENAEFILRVKRMKYS